MGRPSTYTKELLAEICERLAAGESLQGICKTPGMPARTTIQRWATEDVDGCASHIARAREQGLDVLADELIAISDEQAMVLKRDGSEYDPDVQRDTLRVRTRMWYLSKLAPKRYGEKLALEHSGEVNIGERLIAARKRTGTK